MKFVIAGGLTFGIAVFAACGASQQETGRPQLELAEAESLYHRGAYDSARATWLGLLEPARVEGDVVTEGQVLTWLGLVSWRQGDYAEARRLGEQALDLKLEFDLRSDLFKSYNALGLLAWMEGRLSDAIDLYGEAARAASAVDDRKSLAAVSGNLALVQTELGEFAEARGGFEVARDLGRELGDPRVEGNALNNLGMLDIRVGDPRSALEWLREALLVYRSFDYTTGEQNALGQLGTAYAALGEPRLAFVALDSALEQSRRLGLRQDEASNLEALADLFAESGNFRRALEVLEQAQGINRELGLTVEQGTDLARAAEIHLALGDLDLARRHATEAIEIHEATGARFEELRDRLLLAEIAEQSARPSETGAHLHAARELAMAINVRLARLDVSLMEAKLAERHGHPEAVLAALDGIAADLVHGGYGTESEAHALRARAYADLDRLEDAVDAGRLAVAAVERVRGNYGSGALRTAYLSRKAAVYADLVEVLLRLGRVEDAFEVSDAARGRALLEHLTAAKREHLSPERATGLLHDGEVLLRRIEQLVARIDEIEQLVAEEDDSTSASTLDWLDDQLGRARSDYEALLARGVAQSVATVALVGGSAVSPASVRDALAPGERLLEYFATPQRLFVFVISPDEIRTIETPLSTDDLTAKVRLIRELLSSSRSSESERSPAVLVALHGAIVAPTVRSGALEGARRLIIVPHGLLAYVPFAALRDSATGRHLIEDFSLIQLPSAAALPMLRAAAPAPQPEESDLAASIFAPYPDSLPATRTEAMAVRNAVGRADMRLGRRASERRLRQDLSRARLVHVATHAALNPRSPMFSHLELAPETGVGPERDGRLEVHELLGLSVRSPLVFLSGCETAAGIAWSTEFLRGEDYATLAQAFLYAGARNVVATLWRVEDAGAAALAERFYEQLRTAAPAEALARAQRESLRDGKFSAAFYWAPYVLIGHGLWEQPAQYSRVSLDEPTLSDRSARRLGGVP